LVPLILSQGFGPDNAIKCDMKKMKRTEITIETHRVLVIRRPKSSFLAWCAACAEQSQMITPVEAAVLARVSTRPIYRWIEADKLHFTETPDGLLHVCLMHFPPTPRSDSDPLRFTQKG
jgi:hypothetical protein